MSTVDEVTLTERADSAYAEGRPDEALRLYTRLLRADPRNAYAWYRSAVLLGRCGEQAAAVESLDLSAQRLAEAGQLMLAVAAARDLVDLDQAAASRRAEAIAGLYGAGSSRLERGRRPPPRVPAQLASTDEVAEAADLRVLLELAVEACAEAVRLARTEPLPAGSLPGHPLLSDLEPHDLAELLPLATLRAVPAGEVVVEQGAEGTSFFIIARGAVQVVRREPDGSEVQLALLRSGAFFGEMALLTRSPRIASVRCETPALLVELGRAELARLAAHRPTVGEVLASYTRDRLLRNLLGSSPIFQPLDGARREKLVELFESRVFDDGQVVLPEGEPSPGLFVVLSGAVQVSAREKDEELGLAELGPGQFFGEISLIQRRPATATVRACGRTVLLLLPRDTFNEHVGEFPEVIAQVYQVAIERERANTRAAESQLYAVDEDLLLI